MDKKKWRERLACLALVGVTVSGVALAAGTQGSQSDPLVTLSYVNKVAEELMKKADAHIEEKTAQLREELQATSSGAVFETLEVAAGKTVTLSAGTQVILRAGTASTEGGWTDLTTGASAWAALAANHLYICNQEGQTLTVGESAVFLVQGTCRVS